MKYRITYLLGKLDTSVCPPAVLKVIFPSAEPLAVELTESELTVEFATPQTPVDLGPLVRVEILNA